MQYTEPPYTDIQVRGGSMVLIGISDRDLLLRGTSELRRKARSDFEVCELGALLETIDDPVGLASATRPGIELVLGIGVFCNAY